MTTTTLTKDTKENGLQCIGSVHYHHGGTWYAGSHGAGEIAYIFRATGSSLSITLSES